jgi:D-alanyl-D-alanine carboxypeptidase
MRKNIRNLKITRKSPRAMLVLLLAAALVLTLAGCGNGGEGAGGSSGASSVSPGGGEPGGDGDSADSTGLADAGGDSAANAGHPWYYEDRLTVRYEAFAATHPELPEDDIIWMVGVDLDKEPYTQPQEVVDPNDGLVIVSKHFCLPAEYVPTDLVEIGNTQMRTEAAAALTAMITDAYENNLVLWAQSGFRTYGLQVQLYNDYSARDGAAAADTYSARPGFSEHQTGLTMDLNTITDAFGNTREGKWVAEHAHEYGFIVRYTEENAAVTLYKYEPWHIRYIGVEAAQTMYDQGIASFEEYWVKYVKHTSPESGAVG